MRVNQLHSSMLISPARTIVGRVELFESSTLINTFKHTDALMEFTVSRTSEQKFFGFGICQQISVKLVDKERAINIEKGQILKASYGVEDSYVSPYPSFYVTEVTRNENNNQLTIIGYDKLYSAPAKHTVSEVKVAIPFTVAQYANACASIVGISSILIQGMEAHDLSFNVVHQKAANYGGNETIRQIFDDIAEVTQTVYYIDDTDSLVFKRLDRDGNAALIIGKANYFTLTGKEPCVLNAISSTTELGDNVIASLSDADYVQYVRENGLWNLRDDIGSLLDNALAAIGGMVVHPHTCKWRGNYLLEIGDKIEIISKDDEPLTAYVLGEQTTYNGGLVSTLSWDYKSSEKESSNNPSTLGEALNQTTAKVDKISQEIKLSVDKVEAAVGQSAQLQMKIDEINMTVSRHEDEIDELEKKVALSLTQDDVRIEIEKTLEDGVNKVTTKTGYVFGEEGLEISKSDSEMSTMITEDGMTVSRNGDAVLVANNEGVIAEDLHATTYLIIGTNSRFEDYGNRTGCFWIGEWKEAE